MGDHHREIKQCLQSQEIFLGPGDFLIQALNNEFAQLSGEVQQDRKRLGHWRNENQFCLLVGGPHEEPNCHFAD